MLVARLVAVSDLRVEEVPTPSPGPGEVLVEVGANTLCGDRRAHPARRQDRLR